MLLVFRENVRSHVDGETTGDDGHAVLKPQTQKALPFSLEAGEDTNMGTCTGHSACQQPPRGGASRGGIGPRAVCHPRRHTSVRAGSRKTLETKTIPERRGKC